MSDVPPTPDHPPDDKAGQAGQAGQAGLAEPTAPVVPFTRAAALWSSLIVGFLVLIVLLIFITQNTEQASIRFLSFHWSLPLGVALLLTAVGGGLVTVLAGTARIYQLRRVAKKTLAARR